MYADATTFRNLLRRVSVGMQPEGLAGMTNGATPTREAIYISKRKGFIRIAIQVQDALACLPDTLVQTELLCLCMHAKTLA